MHALGPTPSLIPDFTSWRMDVLVDIVIVSLVSVSDSAIRRQYHMGRLRRLYRYRLRHLGTINWAWTKYMRYSGPRTVIIIVLSCTGRLHSWVRVSRYDSHIDYLQ